MKKSLLIASLLALALAACGKKEEVAPPAPAAEPPKAEAPAAEAPKADAPAAEAPKADAPPAEEKK